MKKAVPFVALVGVFASLLPLSACELSGSARDPSGRRESVLASSGSDYVMIGKDARWNEPRPDGFDLSVQFISRTPRYPGIRPEYKQIDNETDGEGSSGPILILNPDAQRNPRAGQVVVFNAVVRNVGTRSIDGFDWAWLYDGADVHEGWFNGPLAPNETASFLYVHTWDDGPHHMAFHVDRDRLIEEVSEENNWVIDRTDALSLAFFVEDSVAAFFTTVRGGLGSYSFEDWAQFQVRQMNKEFRDTIYPTCPDGIVERVRLDRVYRIPDGWGYRGGTHTPAVAKPIDLDEPELMDANHPDAQTEGEIFNNVTCGVDGVWGFSVDLLANKPEWEGKNFYEFSHRWLTGSEWPLHHELGHQLGRVDHYLLPSDGGANRAIPGLAYEPPQDYRDGMMYTGNHAHDNAIGKNTRKWDTTYRFYNEHVARSFNRDQGVRRGLFGEYLFDVPKTNTFAFVDADGAPVGNAPVEVFVAQGRGWTHPGFNAEPNFVGRTSPLGMYTLDRSPWNHVFIGATNGVVMFRVTPASGVPLVGFLDISHFNLAHWRGHEQAARYTVVLEGLPRSATSVE